MKLIYVSGGDYAALNFQNAYSGVKVSDILVDPSKYEPEEKSTDDDDEAEYWELNVHDVGDVSPEFIDFFRNTVQDYDDSKHHNFWMENETVRE